MVWRVDSGQGRARKSGKVECGGCGCTERREDWSRPRAGVLGGQRSVLRRKKEQVGLPGFQLRAPAAAPSQQPSVDHQGIHGSLEPRDRAVMHVQENWCLEKGRPQERDIIWRGSPVIVTCRTGTWEDSGQVHVGSPAC